MELQLQRTLKKILRERDIKLVQLSRATKVAVATLNNWLGGQPPRNISQVKAVADHFGISLDELLYDQRPRVEESFEKHREEINAGIFQVILIKVKPK